MTASRFSRGAGDIRLPQGTRGAISELLASAHLMNKGYHVYRCESPHAPFDLVAYRDGQCLRVEVKSLTWPQPRSFGIAPMFTTPSNYEWDLLVVADACGVFEFPAEGFDIRTAKNIIRAHFDAPLLPEVVGPICGTHRGYLQHRSFGEECEECQSFEKKYQKAFRQRRKARGAVA